MKEFPKAWLSWESNKMPEINTGIKFGAWWYFRNFNCNIFFFLTKTPTFTFR